MGLFQSLQPRLQVFVADPLYKVTCLPHDVVQQVCRFAGHRVTARRLNPLRKHHLWHKFPLPSNEYSVKYVDGVRVLKSVSVTLKFARNKAYHKAYQITSMGGVWYFHLDHWEPLRRMSFST